MLFGLPHPEGAIYVPVHCKAILDLGHYCYGSRRSRFRAYAHTSR